MDGLLTISIPCLLCGEKLTELNPDTKNIKISKSQGVVDFLTSNHDGGQYIVGLCDNCTKASLLNGRLNEVNNEI